MRKIKEALRLHHEAGLSRRDFAQALNISYCGAAYCFIVKVRQDSRFVEPD
jgi:hypothetical protein